MVRKQFIVTDLTRMQGGKVCLAGILDDGSARCIRQLINGEYPSEEWLQSVEGGVVVPFSRVEIDIKSHLHHRPHVENTKVSHEARIIEPAISMQERRELLETIQSGAIDDLFMSRIDWRSSSKGELSGGWIPPDSGNASLGTVRAEVLQVHYQVDRDGKNDYRVTFCDPTGKIYRMPVTDLAFRTALDWRRRFSGMSPTLAAIDLLHTLRGVENLWLRIGANRPWAQDEHSPKVCHLQITAVHTIPDYLDGQNWATLQDKLKKPVD